MKVRVVSVADTSFDGRDGTKVAACKLTFDFDGQRKTMETYIPPVVTAALAWKIGEEVEIEEYTDKNGKARFKTPQSGKGGGGGFKGLSFDERLKLDQFQHERMDRRTALMQAVAATEIPARVLPLADEFYAWLRASESEGSRTAPPLGGSGTVEAPTAFRGSSDRVDEHSPSKREVAGSKPAPGSPPGTEAGEVEDGRSATGAHRSAPSGAGNRVASPAASTTASGEEAHQQHESAQGSARVVGDSPSTSPETVLGGGEGEGPVPQANHVHQWIPVERESMAKKGYVRCSVEGCTVPVEKRAA